MHNIHFSFFICKIGSHPPPLIREHSFYTARKLGNLVKHIEFTFCRSHKKEGRKGPYAGTRIDCSRKSRQKRDLGINFIKTLNFVSSHDSMCFSKAKQIQPNEEFLDFFTFFSLPNFFLNKINFFFCNSSLHAAF